MATFITYFQDKLYSEEGQNLIAPYKIAAKQALPTADHQFKESDSKIGIWLLTEQQKAQCNDRSAHESLDFKCTREVASVRIHTALTAFSDKAFLHFFDFALLQFEQANYTCLRSERREYDRPYWREMTWQHRLAPKTQTLLQEQQLFDEVTVELRFKDGHLCYLQITATVPQDGQPRSSNDFNALLQVLAV